MSVTVKDVARLAGVSTSTVSRAIHNNPRISRETIDRVMKAMEELNYHPHAAARNLARGKSYTLGLIIPSTGDELFINPFSIGAMRGLSVVAQKKGYNIMYYFSSDQEEEIAFIKRSVRMNLIDGVILTISREEDRCMEYLEKRDVPYVLIGRPVDKYTRGLWVDSDNFQAMYNLVIYFLNKGYRSIGFIGGNPAFIVTQDRLRGYKEAFHTHGLKYDDSLVFFGNSFFESTGRALMAEMMEKCRPDALVSTDDTLALGAMDYMKETGEYLPTAGFGNSTKAQIITPGLTSIDIMPELLGRRAAEKLIDYIENPDDREAQLRYSIVETRLVERESTDDEFIRSMSEKYL